MWELADGVREAKEMHCDFSAVIEDVLPRMKNWRRNFNRRKRAAYARRESLHGK